MKIFVQWTYANPEEYNLLDSAAWPNLARKLIPIGREVIDDVPGWIFDINIQGISFGGADHYDLENLTDGSGGVRFTRWWDDPDDLAPDFFWAEVWTILPLAFDPRLGGAINTRQSRVIYAAPGQMARINKNVENTVFKSWSEFVPPTNPCHGIWISNADAQRHEAIQASHGWREWTEGLDPSDFDNGNVKPQRPQGRYKKPQGTKTFFLYDEVLATGIHATEDEVRMEVTDLGLAVNLACDTVPGSQVQCLVWTTDSDEPNKSDWPSGDYRCQIDVNQSKNLVSYGFLTISGTVGHMARVNAALTTDEETFEQIEAAFSGTGIKLATTGTIDPAAGAVDDRWECLLVLDAAGETMVGNIRISADQADSFSDGPWVSSTPGQVQTTALVEVSQNGQSQFDAFVEVAQNGQIQAAASVEVGFVGQQQITALVEVLQNGEVQITASVEVELVGQQQIDASVKVSQNSEVQFVASIELEYVGFVGQVQFDASLNAEQNSEVQTTASLVVKQQSNPTQSDASVEVQVPSEVQIPATLEVGFIGQKQVLASTEIMQHGAIQFASTIFVLQPGGKAIFDASLAAKQNNQVQVAASLETQVPSEVQIAASMEVGFTGEVLADASLVAKFQGEVQVDAFVVVDQNGAVQAVASLVTQVRVPSEVQVDVSISVIQRSQVVADASINAAQNGIVPIILSIFVAQNGTVQVAASIASDIGGRVQIDASINASQNGEVEAVASIEVVQRIDGQVTADGSINAAQNNQIQIVASVQAISLGAVQEAVSIVVSQNAQVTVPVFISVLQAGGEVQIVASISVQENAQIFVNASVQAQVFVFLDGEVQVVASTQVDFHIGLDDRSGAVKHAYIPNSGRFVLRGDTLFIVDNETLRQQQKPAEGFGWDLDLISNPPGELIVKTDKPGSVPLQYKIDRDGGEFDMGVLRIEIPDDWIKS